MAGVRSHARDETAKYPGADAEPNGPGTGRERAAARLLAGHGWRQNELLEVLAGEVRAISGHHFSAMLYPGPN